MTKLISAITLLYLLVCIPAIAQNTAGQILLNGNFSYFSNHSAGDREAASRTVDGILVPSYTYEQKQSTRNFTFAPKAHYFLSQDWSVGLGFGLRRIVTDRYVPSILLSETTADIASTISTKNKTITYSYAPRLEIARHWYLGKHLSINVAAFTSWQLVTVDQKTSSQLGLTPVSDLTSWTVSEDGLRFTPKNNTLNSEKNKEQFWRLGIVPQLRYSFKPRFGITASVGVLSLTQEFKNTREDFVKASPGLAFSVNPGSWTFGLYWVFDGKKQADGIEN